MKNLILFVLLVSIAHAQQWTKTKSHDDLHNKDVVKFVLSAKEPGGGIGVVCSDGKLQDAWLTTDKIADSRVSGTVDLEYRRDDEAKPHRITLPVSEDFHGVLLQSPNRIGLGPRSVFGFEQLLYGPIGFGGGEWRKNKKDNNWAKKVVVGVSAYADSDAVYTFDVPDPSEIRQECGIK